MDAILKLGTRGSPLALAQAHMVAAALCNAHGWPEAAVEIVTVRTTGDRVQDRPLADIGGKALWTKELETALLDGRIDLAVHSMKDVETARPAGLGIVATLARADVRDRLVANDCDSLAGLPHGARLGTSSPRRAAQVLRARPDLVIVPFRGNVDTRLAKLRDGEADATLLAAAGLDRLGRDGIGHAIAVDDVLPAPAQGAVGIEVRLGDQRTAALVAPVGHAPTFQAIMAERAFLDALAGTCHTPLAALATLNEQVMQLRGEILLPDGSECSSGERLTSVGDAAAAAHDLAAELLGRASPALRALFGS